MSGNDAGRDDLDRRAEDFLRRAAESARREDEKWKEEWRRWESLSIGWRVQLPATRLERSSLETSGFGRIATTLSRIIEAYREECGFTRDDLVRTVVAMIPPWEVQVFSIMPYWCGKTKKESVESIIGMLDKGFLVDFQLREDGRLRHLVTLVDTALRQAGASLPTIDLFALVEDVVDRNTYSFSLHHCPQVRIPRSPDRN